MKVIVIGDFKSKCSLIDLLIEQGVEVVQDRNDQLRGRVADHIFIDDCFNMERDDETIN